MKKLKVSCKMQFSSSMKIIHKHLGDLENVSIEQNKCGAISDCLCPNISKCGAKTPPKTLNPDDGNPS